MKKQNLKNITYDWISMNFLHDFLSTRVGAIELPASPCLSHTTGPQMRSRGRARNPWWAGQRGTVRSLPGPHSSSRCSLGGREVVTNSLWKELCLSAACLHIWHLQLSPHRLSPTPCCRILLCKLSSPLVYDIRDCTTNYLYWYFIFLNQFNRVQPCTACRKSNCNYVFMSPLPFLWWSECPGPSWEKKSPSPWILFCQLWWTRPSWLTWEQFPIAKLFP